MTKKKNPSEADARQKALSLLARREYSAFELRHRLTAGGFPADEIEQVVTDFAGRGWLSDERFAGQVVASRARQYGQRRIVQELRDKGVEPETITAALASRETDDESVARSVWLKRFGSPPQTPQEKARQVRFLQNRGFALGLIFRIIGGMPDDDSCPEDPE